MLEYITATYRVPWTTSIAEKADAIAVGMTVGSWTDLPATRQPHLSQYLGEVGAITREGTVGFFEIRYPVVNVRPSIASLLTVVFGKLSLDGLIQLYRLDLPRSYQRAFPGPTYGIPGLRAYLNVPQRPLVMSIFKSENGRSLKEFQSAFQEQIDGGVDLVKDDEIYMADGDAPLLDRIRLAHDLLAEREERTGKKGLYAVNLSGTPRQIMEDARRAVNAGASAFLISAYTLGLDVLSDLKQEGIRVPLIVHPAFSGGQIGNPNIGIHPAILLGLLPRLAGADIVLYPSPYGSVAMPKENAISVADALRRDGEFPAVLPGPSAGIHVGILADLFRDFGADIVINAGGAIHGHPSGTTVGAQILVDAAERYPEVVLS